MIAVSFSCWCACITWSIFVRFTAYSDWNSGSFTHYFNFLLWQLWLAVYLHICHFYCTCFSCVPPQYFFSLIFNNGDSTYYSCSQAAVLAACPWLSPSFFHFAAPCAFLEYIMAPMGSSFFFFLFCSPALTKSVVMAGWVDIRAFDQWFCNAGLCAEYSEGCLHWKIVLQCEYSFAFFIFFVRCQSFHLQKAVAAGEPLPGLADTPMPHRWWKLISHRRGWGCASCTLRGGGCLAPWAGFHAPSGHAVPGCGRFTPLGISGTTLGCYSCTHPIFDAHRSHCWDPGHATLGQPRGSLPNEPSPASVCAPGTSHLDESAPPHLHAKHLAGDHAFPVLAANASDFPVGGSIEPELQECMWCGLFVRLTFFFSLSKELLIDH